METTDPNAAIDTALRTAGQVDLSWIQPPPASDGWTLAPDALRFITRIVEVLQPGHILEMGSGLSTRVLSRAAASVAAGGCAVSSVDHDPQYNWETGIVDGEGRAGNVAFQLAPLVVREFGGKLLGAYLMQPQKLGSQRPVDLAVIDGPPVNLGGREGTLYQVMDFARAGTLVLLDDSKRPEEKAALKAWQDNLGDAVTIRQLPGFAKGMAAAIIHRPVRGKALWSLRFALSRQELETRVPDGEGVAIAGEPWWAQELAVSRPVYQFIERDGVYWGDPEDDEAAIKDLDGLVARGARFFAIGWPSFWWQEHYTRFIAELERRGKRVLENDRLLLFDLR